MRAHGNSSVLIAAIMIAIGFCALPALAQAKLTYPELNTALQVKLPNQSFRNKTELITWLIAQIRSRKVDRPLTKDREDDLRQAGATDDLIGAIRANSPPLPIEPETIVDLGELTRRAVNLVKPGYPVDAQKAGISGTVTLELMLDEQGRVLTTRTISGLAGGLTEQAITAAKASTFSPAAVNGKPAKGKGTITYNFKLNRIDVAATFAAAENYRQASNCAEAIAEYAKILAIESTNSRALAGRGICYVMSGRNDLAIADLDIAARSGKPDDQTYFYRGLAYDLAGNLREANSSYDRSIKLNPELGNWPLMDCVFIDRREVDRNELRTFGDEIVKACNTSLKTAPEFLTTLIYLKRGIGYRLKNDFDRSISDLESARRLNPRFMAVQNQLQISYSSRGNALYNRKEFKQAIEDVTTAININPQNPTPFVNRCIIYLDGLNDLDQAINDCSAAIRLAERYSNAYYFRGLAYERKKELANAMADYKKALDTDPKNTKARDALARLENPRLKKD